MGGDQLGWWGGPPPRALSRMQNSRLEQLVPAYGRCRRQQHICTHQKAAAHIWCLAEEDNNRQQQREQQQQRQLKGACLML